jgi:RNA polymerase sigma factor (TIGR02999 family)
VVGDGAIIMKMGEHGSNPQPRHEPPEGGAGGDPAGEDLSSPLLFERLYKHLRGMADAQMQHEKAGLTLQPTALVHEAYIRLLESGTTWNSPRHFYGAAAEAMRRILIERARRASRHKHGGGRRREELGDVGSPEPPGDPDALLALDESLIELREADPLLADVVMLRYFAGLSVEQTAAVMGRSERSVKSDWAAARAWLIRRIQGPREHGSTDG